ncbi:hypothetical protein [Methyloglobulus morosus]|nr:hypothetical protein [Methyloglobulus morosus]
MATLTKQPLTFGLVVTQQLAVKLPPNVGLRRTVNLIGILA